MLSKTLKWIFVQFSPHLGPFEVIQPSPYFDDPAIVEPKNSYSRITFLYFSRYKHRILDVSIVAAPDLPVVYRGGMLHIQCYSPSGQTPFQLRQGAALFASVRLQDVMNDGEATRLIGQRLHLGYSASQQKKPTSSCVVRRWIFFTLQGDFNSISQNRTKLYNWDGREQEVRNLQLSFIDISQVCLFMRDIFTWWMCRMYGSSTQTSVSRLLMYGLNRAP